MPIVYKQCNESEDAKGYFCNPCNNNTESGRIRNIFFVKTGANITPTSTLEEWTTAVENGDVVIIPNTTGSYDGGAPKMGAGFGNQKERLLGYDFTSNVKVGNYKENYDFWEWAEKQEWRFGFLSETVVHLTNKTVTVNAKAPIEEDLESEVVWNVEVKWFDRKRPVIFDVEPINDLFKCFELGE